MNRTLAVLSIVAVASGIAAAEQQPGFRDAALTVVIAVTPGAGREWSLPDVGPGWVADDLLECLNIAGEDDGVSFEEASGVEPNFRIDVVYTQTHEGTTQATVTAGVSGLGHGHLFNASSGAAPYTNGDDAIQALAEDIYRWIHNGWSYPEPTPAYTTPGYNYYNPSSGSSSPRGWFGLGLSLGRGAGLGSAYVSVQPLDMLGVEADYGSQPVVASGGPQPVTLWPGMFSGKLQLYGGRRTSSQIGIEAAADWADQAGWGAHGAFIVRLRPDPHFNVDLNLGAGHFFNVDSATADYAVRFAKRHGYYPTDLKLGFLGDMPNYLVGGIGFSVFF